MPGGHPLKGEIDGEAKMINVVGITTKALLAYHSIHPQEKPNILISYARLSRECGDFIFSHREMIGSLILDSGTYSLNRNPKKYASKVTLEGYKSYLRQLGRYFDFYFNFDQDYSRDGFEVNLANQLELEQAGLIPVPVVHDCYGHEIQYYIDHGYQMISIGSGELKKEGVEELYRIIEKPYSQGIKIHLLGCTDFSKLAYLPVFSADSATFNQAASRGNLLYWNPRLPDIDKTEKIRFIYGLPRRLMRKHIDDHYYWDEVEEYLNQELNYSIEDLNGPGGITKRLVANLHHFVQLDKRVAAKHRELGFRFWV
jgi:hypothetical protein